MFRLSTQYGHPSRMQSLQGNRSNLSELVMKQTKFCKVDKRCYVSCYMRSNQISTYFPSGQGNGLAVPIVQQNPAVHAVHEMAPPVEKVPATHDAIPPSYNKNWAISIIIKIIQKFSNGITITSKLYIFVLTLQQEPAGHAKHPVKEVAPELEYLGKKQ